MAEVASAYVALLPSARGFGTALNRQVGPQVNRSGALAGAGFGRSMLKAFIAIGVVTKITQFVADAHAEGREAQKVGALTDAVLKSTGGVANVTAKQVAALSDALSLKIGVDDEVIQSAANMLLTFTKVRDEVGKGNDIFSRATTTVQDMAVVFKTSADSAAKQLGKALNDPVKGVTALTRSGASFTEQQKAQITTMVESGNLLGAQKVILRELAVETEGAAEANATWGDKSKVAFENIKESLDTFLTPALDSLGKIFVEKIAPAITGFITNMQSGTGSAGAFGNFIRDDLLPVLRQWYTYVFTKVIPAIVDGLGPALEEGKKAFNKIAGAIRENKPQLTQLFNAFKKVADFILTKLIPAQMKIAAVAIPILAGAIRLIINAASFWVSAFNAVRSAVNKVREAVSTSMSNVKEIAGKIKDAFKKVPGQLEKIGGQIVDGLVAGIKAAAHLVGDAVQAIIDKIPQKIRDIMHIGSPSKVTFELGLNIAEGLANGITAGGKKVSDATKKAVDGIKSQLSTLKGDFASLSESVASAFTGDLFGAETAAEFISNLMGTSNHLAALKAAFKTLIGWGLSPKFLSGLFQSGNGALILDLAASGQGAAAQAADLFGEVQSLSTSLGKDVAGTELAPRLDKMSNQLERLIKVTKDNQDKAADHIDRPAKRARRRARVHA